MSALLKGLALGYALCGSITALIYLAMLPRPRMSSIATHWPLVVLIILSGPLTSGVMFWNTLNELLTMRNIRALEHDLRTLLTHFEQSRARNTSPDSRASELLKPPSRNNQHWN